MQAASTTHPKTQHTHAQLSQQQKYLHHLFQKIAHELGYTAGNGQDLILIKQRLKIACLIPLAATDQEIINIRHQFEAACSYVLVTSPHTRTIQKLQHAAQLKLDASLLQRTFFIKPERFPEALKQIDRVPNGSSKVKGYLVKVRHKALNTDQTN